MTTRKKPPTTDCPNCGAKSVPGNTDGRGDEVCMTCRQPLKHKEAK
jgi:hypothetical protein